MRTKIIVIIANSQLKNSAFNKKLIKQADIIICADGGANKIAPLKITPHYLIGDMDSVKKSVLRQLTATTKIIIDHRQHNTDLEKAILFAETLHPSEIKILGALGNNLDHTIANVISLHHVCKKLKISILDEQHTIFLLNDNSVKISGKRGDIISVIPIAHVHGLSYQGLKWSVKNKKVSTGWCGVRNQMIANKALISLKKGKALVIKIMPARSTYTART